MEEIKKANADIFIVVAYGKILPQSLISMPRLGTLNIHYSLLPKYRGASPVEQALLSGDTTTGVTVQQMAFKLDSGAILGQETEPITIDDMKESLKERLIKIGADLLLQLLPDIQAGIIEPQDQDETRATYCTKIKKEDGLIDLTGDAIHNYNKYRAYRGWPGVYFFVDRHGKNTRVKITKARYENDSFSIERVIPEGKKEIEYQEFLRSNISK
jgi:methionyl-tRNA formyltransferase